MEYHLIYHQKKKDTDLAKYDELEKGLDTLLNLNIHYSANIFKKYFSLIEKSSDGNTVEYSIKRIKNKNLFWLYCNNENKYLPDDHKFFETLTFCNNMEKKSKKELYNIYRQFGLKKCNKCFTKKSTLKHRLLEKSKVNPGIIEYFNSDN